MTNEKIKTGVNMNVLFKSLVGSKLFGLDTPDSDTDYKGVFIPPIRDLLLGSAHDVIDKSTKVIKEKQNDKNDVDEVYFSLRKFIELLISGDTTAFDMLHAPERAVLNSSPEFEYLRANRNKFYTSRLEGLFGQVIAESRTYATRSLRASYLKQVVDALNQIDDEALSQLKLKDIMVCMPIDNVYLRHVLDVNQKAGCQDFYEVLDRKFQYTIKGTVFKNVINELWKNYGERVKSVELKSGGNDWKSLSHAFRIGYQLLDIYTKGDYTFPLEQSDFIKNVKSGEIPMDICRAKLQGLIDAVKDSASKSGLPMSVDIEPWYDWVADIYADVVNRNTSLNGGRHES